MTDKELAHHREEIRGAMQSAWNTYKKYAWGYDFLLPQTHCGKNEYGLGMTIIDSLDTLLIMNMTKEFEEAREWIRDSLQMDTVVSFFETVIRAIGGLISTYEMTNDELFLDTARNLGNRLMYAFNTSTGFPRSYVNLSDGSLRDHSWARGTTMLADIGSCQLEFMSLTEHTGDQKYAKAAMDVFRKLGRFGALPVTHISYNSMWPSWIHHSLDAFGDSYFEYLMKMEVFAPRNITRRNSFHDALKSAERRLGFTSITSKHVYFSSAMETDHKHLITHLIFFLPGVLFLAADECPEYREKYLSLASTLLDCAVEIYEMNKSGLGSESVHYTLGGNGIGYLEDTYKLRPELVESLFYGWRITHRSEYRRIAWKICQSILKYCSVNGAFTSVSDVKEEIVIYENMQESFFMSETLKYLYLIFSDDDTIPLSEYVFNTQAHPLRKLPYRKQ